MASYIKDLARTRDRERERGERERREERERERERGMRKHLSVTETQFFPFLTVSRAISYTSRNPI